MPSISPLLDSTREWIMTERKSPTPASITSPRARVRSPQLDDEDPRHGDEYMATKSAFEITSVSHLPEEHEEVETINIENSNVSKDPEEFHNSLKELTDRSSNRLSTSSGESDEVIAMSKEEPPPHDQQHSIVEEPVPLHPSPKPEFIAVATANGPTQLAPSRFRRVNQYIRGRWLVRDAFEPEERPESELKMATIPKTSDSLSTSVSPLVARKSDSYIDHQQQVSISSDSESNIVNQDVLLHNDKVPSATGESIHSLSRTGSMSSVVKSVEEDDRELGTHEDTESTTSVSLSTRTPDFPSTAANITADTPSQLCVCEECTAG